MKRTPIVLAGTVAGLVGVLSFHTTPARLGLPVAAGGSGNGGSGTGTGPGAAAAATPAAGQGGATGGRNSSASPSPASSSGPGPAGSQAAGSQATGTRSATGPDVNYFYGVLSVRVTVSGHKITKVSIGSLNDGGNPRSQYIDQQSIPMLEQEVMQAQSASIQGVSGASYTSAGFVRSLQSALHTLGVQ